jgi:hypothetical protein
MATDPAFAPEALLSRRRLLQTTVGAFGVSVVILFTTVLPVEYDTDPLGTGKLLGLMRTPPAQPAPVVSAKATAELLPQAKGPASLYGAPYRTNSFEVTLQPYDFIEYKYHLAKGASMVFAWSASAPVTHDFHGEPDANPENVVTYDKSDTRSANGSLVAPVTGVHGWYWENTSNEPVTVKLESSGFYTHAMEYHSDQTRARKDVSTIDPTPSAKSPS